MELRLAIAVAPAPVLALVLSACTARTVTPDKGPIPASAPSGPAPPATPAAPRGPLSRPLPASEPPTAPPEYVRMHASAVVPTREGEVVLLLDDSEAVALPIFIGGTEATAIRWRLEKRRFERPLTHDLLDALMREVGAELDKVQVDDLRSSVFIGSVFVRKGDRVFELDARPSDAIALAIGNRAPIFVACRVLEKSALPHASPGNPAEAPDAEPRIKGCKAKAGLPTKTTATGI
jgi:hypothetical protein